MLNSLASMLLNTVEEFKIARIKVNKKLNITA